MAHLIRTFAELRWRLLRGTLRGTGAEKAGVVLSTVASVIVGVGAGVLIATAGRTVADDGNVFVIVCTAIPLAVVGISVVAGVAQPLDPRVIATEPLTDRERAIGLLVAAAVGPPGLAGLLVGVGLAAGAARGPASLVLVVPIVAVWLLTLLLLSRTATNLLALVSTRFPRAGQLVVGIGGLLFYGAFQIVPRLLAGLDVAERERVAGWGEWSPLGQTGRALAAADDRPVAALGHLAVAAAFVAVLAVVFDATTRRLTVAVRTDRATGGRLDQRGPAALVRRLCGRGGVGAVAWRSILTRMRTPRTAIETVTGAGVGLAAVLVPALVRDGAGGGAVLVGGAVQLGVLFIGGNSFGNDGPPITGELLTGAPPAVLAAGKARSIVVVASPLAVAGPVAAAAVTGEWAYLPAGLLVGVGALLAGAGGAIVQSTLVPIAVPDSDNPFTSGESGRSVVAALLLGGVLVGLAIVTLPVALALLWAIDRDVLALLVLLGAVATAAGWAVLRAGVAVAARRIAHHGPELVRDVTPAR